MDSLRSSPEHRGATPDDASAAVSGTLIGELFDPRACDGCFERLRAELLANISDELRTPLKRILAPLRELEDGAYGVLGDRARKRVVEARRKAAGAVDLIDRLVNASRLDAGALELHAGRGDLIRLLKSVVERFASRAEHENIDLRFEGHAVTPEAGKGDAAVELRFDPILLGRVFANLIANALGVTAAGGRVRITVIAGDDPEDCVRVRISDDGPGIAAVQLPRIFDRSGGAANPSSPYATGAGLGLSLARDLVELHGGGLTVETVEGVGSTFIVRLPPAAGSPVEVRPRLETSPIAPVAPQPPAPRPLIESPAEVPSTWSTPAGNVGHAGEYAPLVLVASEPSVDSTALHRHLADHYRLAEATDGVEALERARELLPDVVVCEEQLDRLDGHALCREIKRDPELDFVPVILVTPGVASKWRSAEDDEGADVYLPRHLEAVELITRIDRLIAARSRLLERFSGSGVSVAEPGGLPVIPGIRATQEDCELLESVRQVIAQHLGDREFRIDDLAGALALDRADLDRRLRVLTGLTPARLILELRLKVAAHQLTDAGAPISEIAWMVGFRGLDHFNRRFRARFRMTATASRARW